MRSVSWRSESSNENWGLSVCKDMNQAVCVHYVHSLDITYIIPKTFNICGKFITLHIWSWIASWLPYRQSRYLWRILYALYNLYVCTLLPTQGCRSCWLIRIMAIFKDKATWRLLFRKHFMQSHSITSFNWFFTWNLRKGLLWCWKMHIDALHKLWVYAILQQAGRCIQHHFLYIQGSHL